MAQSVPLPDGSSVTIREGETPEATYARAQQMYPEAFTTTPPQEEKPTSGILSALGSGFRGGLGEAAEGAGEAMGLAGLSAFGKRQQEIAQARYKPTSDQDVNDAIKKGVFPEMGAYASQFLEPYAQSAGSIAGRFGVPMAAPAAVPFVLPEAIAAAPFAGGALGAVGLGTIGAAAGVGAMALADAPIEIGQKTLERKKAGLAPDPTSDIEYGLAATALNTLSGGLLSGPMRGLFGKTAAEQAKLLAPKVLSGEITAEVAAGQISGRLTNIARSTAENAVVGSGMMAGNVALSRSAEGKDVTGAGAAPEYEEALKGALTLAPMFGIAHGFGAKSAVEPVIDQAAATRAAGIKAQTDAATVIQNAQLEAEKQTLEYGKMISDKYAALQQQYDALKTAATGKLEDNDLAGKAAQVEAKKTLKDFMAADETKQTVQDYNRYQAANPPAPAVDPQQQVAALQKQIEDVQTQAQGLTDTAQIQALGQQHTALTKQLKTAQSVVDALPPAPVAPPAVDAVEKQVKARTKKMQDAITNGDITAAGQHAAAIEELNKQIAPEAATPVAETAAPVAPREILPPSTKPYTGIAEQRNLLPDTGVSLVNTATGKAPDQTRAELIAEFQAAKQVRNRLGMANAVEKMRVLQDRSKMRSEIARGIGAPKGIVTSAENAKDILGQRLTATGSQAPSTELTNAKTQATPETLRQQLAALPEKLPPKTEALLHRLVTNFDKFTADPENTQLAAGWLHDIRTGLKTSRSMYVETELNRIENAAPEKAASLFGTEELPTPTDQGKPLATATQREYRAKVAEKIAELAETKKNAGPLQVQSRTTKKALADIEAEHKALQTQKETQLQTLAAEHEKQNRAAEQAHNDALVHLNELPQTLDSKIAPLYAEYVAAMRHPDAANPIQKQKQLTLGLAYSTAKQNAAHTVAEAKAVVAQTKAARDALKIKTAGAFDTAAKEIDAAQKEQKIALSRKALGLEAQQGEIETKKRWAKGPEKRAATATKETQHDREEADRAKRLEENKQAARLAAIPGEAVSFDKYRASVATVEELEPRLAELSAKATDESLPKPTRDKANRDIKRLSAARKFIEASATGDQESRLKAEETLEKLRAKIDVQKKAVVDNPTKARKQELAKSKREEKALVLILKGFNERSERTTIETTTVKEAGAEKAKATAYEKAKKEAATKGEVTPRMEALLELINDPTESKFNIAQAQKQYDMLEKQRLPARKVGPVVTKVNIAGNIRTGVTGEESTSNRLLPPGNKPTQGGATKAPTPEKAVEEGNKAAAEKVAKMLPLKAADIKMLDLRQHFALFEAAERMRTGIEDNIKDLQELNERAENSDSTSKLNTLDAQTERKQQMESLERDLAMAKANEARLKRSYTEEDLAAEEVEAPVAEEDVQEDVGVEGTAFDESSLFKESSLSRGIEVESPDLSKTQREHIANNKIQDALRDLSDDSSASDINRAVARKLWLLLDKTDIGIVKNLKEEKTNNPILGQAISSEIELDADKGLSQEVFLHEGTHAAVDRVLVMPEDKLTPTQLAAKRELKALFESAKRDPSITSANAKSSLKEFAAEVLSNRNLQEQLRNKKWTVSDAFRGFVSTILRLVGFTKAETDTMLGASIKSVEALMVPSSKRGLTSERAINAISAKGEGVPRSSSVKDIAALHNGSNSMKQFADQFGPDIKAKDRTPEDAERIGREHLDEISRAVDKAESNRIRRTDPEAAEKLENRAKEMREYIALPTVDSLDYRVRMPDGKPYDENNPLHYIESTIADHLNMKAQTDPKLRLTEAGELSKKRLSDYSNLLFELRMSNDFTSVERALIAKAAGKFSVISDDNGRLKLVDIGADNRHNVAVVSAADAAFIVQKLREGLPLKKAFLEGLQDNADRNVKQNAATHKTGWQKFEQSDTEKAAQELSAGAAGTPWCTAREAHSRGQIARGDFYIYYDNGRPEVAVRMEGNQIGEVRGNSPSQSINTKQQQIAEDFLRAKKFAGHKEYIQEFTRKNALLALVKDPESVKPAQIMQFDLSSIKNTDVEKNLEFQHLDGHESGIRATPTDKVVEFFKEKLIAAGEKAMEAGYYPTRINVAGRYRDSVVITRFNGVEREINSANVVAANRLVIPSYADAISADKFPELSFVNGLGVGADATFPKLRSIGVLKAEGDVALNLPTGARISSVEQDSQKPTNLMVRGASVIEQINAPEYANREFNVKAPDARYIPKEAVYEEGYQYQLLRVTNDNKIAAKYGDEEIAIAKLAERMPNAIRKEFEVSTSTQPASPARYILANAISNNTKRLKDYAAVNKVINAFWKPTDTYDILPETFGTIDAPNRIAENPPFGELTETPEGPSYARVAKYNPELKDAGEMAERVVATQRPLSEKINSSAMGRAAKEFEIKAVDGMAGILSHQKGMEQLAGTQMQYYLRMVGQRLNLLGQAVGRGFPELKKTLRPDGRSEYIYESKDGGPTLVKVVEALRPANKLTGGATETNNLFSLYEIAKRSEGVGIDKMNFDPSVTKEALDKAMDQIRSVPGLEAIFDGAHNEYREFNKDAINFGVSTGAFSKELGAKLLANKDYVPYYRENNDGSVSLMMGNESITKVGNVKDQPYLHELVGGDARIVDFATSSVRNANMILDMGLRNRATWTAAHELQAIGLARIVKGMTRSRPNTLHFKVNGIEHHAIVESTPDMPAELLVKGMAGIPVQTSALLRLVGAPSRLLRHAFVANPISAGRIVFKDTISSMLVGGSDFGGLSAALKNVKGNLMERRGLSGGEVYTGLPEDLSKILRQVQSGKPGWENALAKGYALHAKADAMTRQIRYESYIKQGLSEMEASLQALESMNFTRRGISPSLHVLNAINPFMNSQIQGVNTLVKALRGNMPFNEKLKIQQKIIQRGMMIAGATMLYTAYMQDDESYQRATPEQKYNNLLVDFPGVDEKVHVPIPFEAGILFKAVPEALVNFMYGHDKEAATAMRMMTQKMIPGGDTDYVPQILKPAIEVGLGKSFYTGRDIESKHEQSLVPGQRSRDSTSGFSTALGEALNISPIKIDHLINGYTGQLGLAVTQMASSIVFGSKQQYPAEKTLSQQPLIGGLFQPKDAGNIVEEAYQTVGEAEQVRDTLKDMIAKNRIAEAQAFLEKNATGYAQSQIAPAFHTAMNQAQKAIQAVQASTLPPEEKRRRLDIIKAFKTKESEQVLSAIEKTKHP